MTYNDLVQLIAVGENDQLEFKSASGGLPNTVWETFSAFANSVGGCIVLGVEENSKGYVIVGVKDAERLSREIWNHLNNDQKISVCLCKKGDIKIIKHGQIELLVIHVPAADRHNRPVFVNNNVFKGSYKRNYEGDYHCTDAEVRQMLRDASDEVQDFKVIPQFNLTDIDNETLQSYRQRFRSRHADHPFLGLDDKELLTNLGGYRKDRNTGEEGLTLAGLLMFGKELSIREALPHFHLDYQERLSSDPEVRWVHRISQDGTWEANLYNFYFRTYNRLVQDINVPFALDKEGVRIGETHVHEAIREGLVNALVHANHQSSKPLLIVKKKELLTFTNPGRLRISIDQLYNGGVSDARNPTLQKMFQLIGLGEKAGSGFIKILRAWREQSWLQPLVKEDLNLELTYVTLPFMSMVPEKVKEYLANLIGAKDYSSLTMLQRLILILAHQGKSISNQEVANYTSEHKSDIGDELSKMVSRGWLFSDGFGRGKRYRLNRDKAPDLFFQDNGTNKSLPYKEINSESGIPHKAENIPHKDINIPHKDINIPHKDKMNLGIDDVNNTIERVQGSKRVVDPVLMQEAISIICKTQYVTVENLAIILNRAVGTLRNILTSMVKNGTLILKYPDQPKHPQQAYKTSTEQK